MREQLQALLAGMLVIVIGFFGYNTLFHGQEDAQLVVIEAAGSVVRTDGGGKQEVAIVGMALHPRDELAVGPGSSAALQIGEETRLSLEAESAIRVIGIENSSVRVELEEGRVSARVRPNSPALSVTSRGRAVFADDADFTMATDLDGVLNVNAEAGTLSLSGFDQAATLAPGQRLSALPGAPAVIAPIPEGLLLDVEWPQLVATREEELFLEGRTAPFAAVSVVVHDRSMSLRAGADGRFRAPFQLSEGGNPVSVVVRDALGNHQQTSRAFERTSMPPPLNIQVDWGP